MYDDLRPADANLITRLVHFNSLFVSRYLHCFSSRLFSALHKGDLIRSDVCAKGELKDAIVKNPPHLTPRIEELIHRYQEHPGLFYRETPFEATLYFMERQGRPMYIGSSRGKRIRRLAEKGARRIIDGMFDSVKRRAEELADERARQLGIPREYLITTPEEMISEFLHAEEDLLEKLRLGLPVQGIEERAINDVAGIKVLAEKEDQAFLIGILNRMPDCAILETEHHTGRYNATNLIVSYRPPREDILLQAPSQNLLAIMRDRGWDEKKTREAFIDFVRTGEESIQMELIVSSYAEMLESEIGRSMHEDRIIRQRLQQEYRGHLAKNIEYLMRYLFMFPFSGQPDLRELPIKIWNHYLPDYFDSVIAELFQVSPYRRLE